MDVQTLIEELQKLPPAVLHQTVKVERSHWHEEVTNVRWQGTHVQLETD